MWERFKKSWNKVKATFHGVSSWIDEMLNSGNISDANKKFSETYYTKNAEYTVAGWTERGNEAIKKAEGFVNALFGTGLSDKPQHNQYPRENAARAKQQAQRREVSTDRESELRTKYNIPTKDSQKKSAQPGQKQR